MVDLKKSEEACYNFLKTLFDEVIWLSYKSYSPIDFKCKKGEVSYLIEAKYKENGKVNLSPNQRNVDAVVIDDGNKIEIVWRNDFKDRVNLSEMSLIKISTHIKSRLDKLKKYNRETYNDVIERLTNSV